MAKADHIYRKGKIVYISDGLDARPAKSELEVGDIILFENKKKIITTTRAMLLTQAKKIDKLGYKSPNVPKGTGTVGTHQGSATKEVISKLDIDYPLLFPTYGKPEIPFVKYHWYD